MIPQFSNTIRDLSRLPTTNIQHNGELTEQEKWRAIDKVKGLTLGSTEKQALAVKQAEHDKKIRDQARKEALAELQKGFGNHA